MIRKRGKNYGPQLRALMEESGLDTDSKSADLAKAAAEIGCAPDTLYRWINWNRYPKLTCPKWAYDIFRMKRSGR